MTEKHWLRSVTITKTETRIIGSECSFCGNTRDGAHISPKEGSLGFVMCTSCAQAVINSVLDERQAATKRDAEVKRLNDRFD